MGRPVRKSAPERIADRPRRRFSRSRAGAERCLHTLDKRFCFERIRDTFESGAIPVGPRSVRFRPAARRRARRLPRWFPGARFSPPGRRSAPSRAVAYQSRRSFVHRMPKRRSSLHQCVAKKVPSVSRIAVGKPKAKSWSSSREVSRPPSGRSCLPPAS